MNRKERPPITWSFLLAIVGITANQGFYLVGLDNTSPTFALVRIEKVRLDRKDGVSKVAGLLICVCHHALQGARHLHPCDAALHGSVGRCELDDGMPLPDRPLPVMGRLARAAGACAQKVSRPPLLHLLPVLLWDPPVPRHRCLLREEWRGLAHPHRLRGLQRLLRCKY